MKTYLIVLPGTDVDRDDFIAYLKSKGIVNYWFYSLINAVFINSKQTAGEISDIIRQKYGAGNRHFVVNVTDTNYQGWLPKDHWELFIKK